MCSGGWGYIYGGICHGDIFEILRVMMEVRSDECNAQYMVSARHHRTAETASSKLDLVTDHLFVTVVRPLP